MTYYQVIQWARANEKACANCKHYQQHYISVNNGGYVPCFSGHCMYLRLKATKPTQSCDNFEKL